MKRFADHDLTTNMGRIGGFERNFNDTAFQKLEKFLKEYPDVLKEFENLFQRNRIFMDRTIGTGAISAERALNYGFTGPNLRAAGVDYDVRVHTPYCSYEDFDFIIPVGKTGDNYDRLLVRNQEMWQSLQNSLNRLIKKCRNSKEPMQKFIMLMFRNIICRRNKMCIQRWKR